MLAQSFLTPKQLRISDHEHSALRGILGMLERGELQHINLDLCGPTRPYPPHPFNMRNWSIGACHCIGGWADFLYHTNFAGMYCCINGTMANAALTKLFYGSDTLPVSACVNECSGRITVAQAASALRNYLTIGQPHWDEVLAEAVA